MRRLWTMCIVGLVLYVLAGGVTLANVLFEDDFSDLEFSTQAWKPMSWIGKFTSNDWDVLIQEGLVTFEDGLFSINWFSPTAEQNEKYGGQLHFLRRVDEKNYTLEVKLRAINSEKELTSAANLIGIWFNVGAYEDDEPSGAKNLAILYAKTNGELAMYALQGGEVIPFIAFMKHGPIDGYEWHVFTLQFRDGEVSLSVNDKYLCKFTNMAQGPWFSVYACAQDIQIDYVKVMR